MRKFASILSAFLVFCSLFAHRNANAVDPRLDYRIIETEHFDVIYDARQKQLALDYAVQAEKSQEILEKVFNHTFPSKTALVVDDSVDLTNGSATTLPRSTIYAFPVLPTATTALDHYGVWSRDLVRHEYTHILNMEPTSGVWTPIRFMFGSLIRPNMLLPRWYLEGLAVEMESRFTPHGRLRSPTYPAMIRSEVLDNKWGHEDISQINEVSIPTWPRGQRPYYYGALLWHYMVHEKTVSIIGNLNERYSGRFPFFINGPAEDNFQANYSGILDEAYEFYQKDAQNQIQTLKKSTQTPPVQTIEIDKSFTNHSPAISPDETKMVFVSYHADTGCSIQMLERDPQGDFVSTPKQLVSTSDTNRASWFPDSQRIVYDKTDTFDRVYNFYDLYIYDLAKKEETRVTNGMRATEPVVSPDGKQILYVLQEANQTKLGIIDSDGKNFKILYVPATQTRVTRPIFIRPDEVMFSEHSQNGDEFLYLLSLTTLKPIRVLENYPQAKFAELTKKGLLFASEKSGVQNLYLSDLGFKEAHPITNSLTEVMNGTLDTQKNKIYVSQLNSTGYQLQKLDIPTADLHLSKIENPIEKELPNALPTTSNKFSINNKNYSALKYMFPQFWYPGFLVLSNGFVVSASTFASDPLNLHAFSLDADYDSRNSLPSFSGAYAVTTGIGSFILEGFLLNSYFQAFATTSQTSGGEFFYKSYIWGLSNKWTHSLGWAYNRITNPLLTSVNIFQGPFYSINYSDTSKKGYQISPTGKEFNIFYNYYLPNDTNTQYQSVTGEAAYYHTALLPQYHTILLKAQGYYSPRNRSVLLGTETVLAPYLIQLYEPTFVMRGYPSGEFVGWETYLGTFEYRFPIAYPFSGSGTLPLFFQKISLSLFGDFLNLNGGFVNTTNALVNSERSKIYSSYGAEFVFDLTGFYHLPMTFKVGYAFGTEPTANGGSNIYMNLSI